MDSFHEAFDAETKAMLEPTREALLEGAGTVTREQLIGQLMMDNLFAHVCDPEANDDWPCGPLTTEQKKFLVGVASHMGPDWTQALYHAVVFMTKVA